MSALPESSISLSPILSRALADARAQTLLLPGEPLHDASPADRRYPFQATPHGIRVVTDLYEHDGREIGRRRFFREFDDDEIDLAFVGLLGDWSHHSIPNMLTLGDGLLMVGRGVFVYAGHDGDELVYSPERLAWML